MNKTLPFTKEQIIEIINQYPTPFHLYDEKGIRENARRLKKAFNSVHGFKEYFAVKALPNPFILKILKEEGFGADCSSLPELLLSEKVGLGGEDIMFTSNDTPAREYQKAKELGAIINLDDISHIEFLEKHAGLPELVCFRYNPGPLRKGNVIIGHPEEAKYGFTREQLFEGYRMLKAKGVKRFGLHTMVASNELDNDYFVETARMLLNLVVDISTEVGIDFDFINMGGGIGIAYKPTDQPVSYEKIADGVDQTYEETIYKNGLHPPKVFLECGRVITGPYGYLVSTVLHKKNTYKNFVGLDANMANLMRPAIYGAYHHLTVSDIVAIHDTGAHGHAMGFNYNGKFRSAELLLRENGEVMQIRRAETSEDYFATLDFQQLENFRP
jgi:diaminopimelate decarboxylase